MKNKISLLVTCVFILSFIHTNAQSSGRIIYEEKAKLNINVEGGNEEMLRNLPKEHIVSKELIFDSTASIFQEAKKTNHDDELGTESEHGKMVIKMDSPDNKVYCDLAAKKRIEQRDFMSRMFLIEIPFSASTWKLTGKQKNILNYACQEAILQDTVRKITAWFTSAIPVSTGPNGVCNLPGLVLAAEMNGGDISFEAKNVDLGPVDHKLIVRPTEGKKVTREEFNKIVMEKNKEMGDEGQGNGNVIIRIKK